MSGSTEPPFRPGVTPGAVRVGHAEREAAAAYLQRHFAEGRLNWDELDERLGAAYAARVQPDLDVLFADLPRPAQPAPAAIPFAPPIVRTSSRPDIPPRVLLRASLTAVIAAVLLGVFHLAPPGIAFVPLLALVLLMRHHSHGGRRQSRPSAPRLGNPYAPGGTRHTEVQQLRHRHGVHRD